VNLAFASFLLKPPLRKMANTIAVRSVRMDIPLAMGIVDIRDVLVR
jgi:hypothetical protein